MKKQKMYTAQEVAKLINNQLTKEPNIKHGDKKKMVKEKQGPKRVPTAAKKSKNKIKSVSQKRLLGREKIEAQPTKTPVKKPVKKEIVSKISKPTKKEELPKKRPSNFFSKLLNGFKKKRV